jgi:glycosyltransferase involved in cell wall biosynthesis
MLNPNLFVSKNGIHIQPRQKAARWPVQKLRAVMCSHNLNWEGAPQSQYELATALKLSGVIEPVIYSPEDGPLRMAYQDHGIEVNVKTHPLLGVHSLHEFDEAISEFAEFFNGLNIEIVYANTLQTFYAIAAAERMGLPSLWNPRESEPWQTYFDFLPQELRNSALGCFRYPYRVIFVSEATRVAWEPLNSAYNFTVIHNGLDVHRLKGRCAGWNRNAARRALNLQDEEIAILLMGTVCDRKGQEDLPVALAELPLEIVENLWVYLVGDRESDYSRRLKRMISELPSRIGHRIHVIPETHDVGLYYFAADVFVCTSRLESYPRVILEAMAFGLPIITTDVFGIKEQVGENINALFYEPGDTISLGKALARVISDSEVRTTFGSNSLKMLRALDSFEDMVASYAELFREAYLSKGYPASRIHSQTETAHSRHHFRANHRI